MEETLERLWLFHRVRWELTEGVWTEDWQELVCFSKEPSGSVLNMDSLRAQWRQRDQLGGYCNNLGEKMRWIYFSSKIKGAEIGGERRVEREGIWKVCVEGTVSEGFFLVVRWIRDILRRWKIKARNTSEIVVMFLFPLQISTHAHFTHKCVAGTCVCVSVNASVSGSGVTPGVSYSTAAGAGKQTTRRTKAMGASRSLGEGFGS